MRQPDDGEGDVAELAYQNKYLDPDHAMPLTSNLSFVWEFYMYVNYSYCTNYWADQKNLVKGCRETLDCYCISCEFLSASIADAL